MLEIPGSVPEVTRDSVRPTKQSVMSSSRGHGDRVTSRLMNSTGRYHKQDSLISVIQPDSFFFSSSLLTRLKANFITISTAFSSTTARKQKPNEPSNHTKGRK